jgi:hypothetical protein
LIWQIWIQLWWSPTQSNTFQVACEKMQDQSVYNGSSAFLFVLLNKVRVLSEKKQLLPTKVIFFQKHASQLHTEVTAEAIKKAKKQKMESNYQHALDIINIDPNESMKIFHQIIQSGLCCFF